MEPWMLIVVTIILIVLFFGGNLLLKRVYSKKILAAMTSEDFDGFFKILDSFGCKYALRPFDREMMRLSAYIASGRSKAVDEQMQIMLNMRVNKKNKLTIAMRAFYYYVEKKNRHKAYDMIKVVEENGSPDAAKEMRMVASVLLRKEAKYIKEMKAYYDNALNPVRNRKVFALSPTASIERVMLTISNGSSESVTLSLIHISEPTRH